MYLFTILGLIASHKYVEFEYRRKICLQIMDNLMNKLGACDPNDRERVDWNIKYITVFTKGFQSEVSQ